MSSIPTNSPPLADCSAEPFGAGFATLPEAGASAGGAFVGWTLVATTSAPPATAIIGGTSAQTGTFPSLAYVVDFQGQLAYQCTGTVVAPSLVLTAGHCAENMQTGAPFSPSGFRVVTGAVDPLQPGEPRLDGARRDRLSRAGTQGRQRRRRAAGALHARPALPRSRWPLPGRPSDSPRAHRRRSSAGARQPLNRRP